MPRRKRIHFFNAMYHVMMRGNYRQDIFFSDEHRYYFYSLLKKACEQYEAIIHLFCLMTNHIHMVIEVKHVPLSKIIQVISTSYSRYINKQTSRIGHLFQGRYQAKLIQDENYLLELCDYIHRNPLKAKLVDDLELYPWSSHLSYLNKQNLAWLTTDFINTILKKYSNYNENHYYYFLQDRLNNFSEPKFCEIDEDGTLNIKDHVNRHMQTNHSINLSGLSIKEISEVVCSYLEIDTNLLISNDYSQPPVLARCLTSYFVHYYGGYHLIDIALYLGRDAHSLGKRMHQHLASQHVKKQVRAIENIFLDIIIDRQ